METKTKTLNINLDKLEPGSDFFRKSSTISRYILVNADPSQNELLTMSGEDREKVINKLKDQGIRVTHVRVSLDESEQNIVLDIIVDNNLDRQHGRYKISTILKIPDDNVADVKNLFGQEFNQNQGSQYQDNAKEILEVISGHVIHGFVGEPEKNTEDPTIPDIGGEYKVMFNYGTTSTVGGGKKKRTKSHKKNKRSRKSRKGSKKSKKGSRKSKKGSRK